MAELAQSQQEYQFTAKPQVVKDAQTRYREQGLATCNIMWDKRVVRGNTYSSIVTQKTDPQASVKVVRRRPKNTEMQDQQDEQDEAALRGRKREHQEVQTDENVEELTDKPPNYQKECQTDFIIEKEVPRLYMKVKTGVDKETQVWDDGELFNFDYEVEPILQQLLGKTLEVSRMEVLEEEELREMQEQQNYYTQLREAQMMEQQRLEEVEKQHFEDNLRLTQAYQAKKQIAIKAHEKLVSRVLAKQFLKTVERITLTSLNNQGYFRPELEVALERDYLPWLYGEVQNELQSQQSTEESYTIWLQSVSDQLNQAHTQVHSLEMKNRSDVLEERERQRVEQEERNAKRREARKKRLERERRQRIKDAVLEKIVAKGELKANSLGGVISDLDGYQQPTAFLGLFGGLLDELIIFISTLQEMGNDNSYPPLKLLVTNDGIDELVSGLLIALAQIQDLVIEIGISQNAEAALENIQAGLTIAGLNGVQVTSAQIQTLLQENLYSIVHESIRENYLTFGIAKEIIDLVETNLIKHALNNEVVRPKIRFVKVNNEVKKYDQQCVARVRPNLEELSFHNKSGKTKSEHVQDGDEPVENINNPVNLAEAEIEPKATALVTQADDLRILVHHSITELNLRETAIECVGEVIQLDAGSEYNLLVDLTSRCEALQNAILDVIAPDIPVLDLGIY